MPKSQVEQDRYDLLTPDGVGIKRKLAALERLLEQARNEAHTRKIENA